MKNFTQFFVLLFFGISITASANSKLNIRSYPDSFIFVEGGVEFAVYPNGEFDFYYQPQLNRGFRPGYSNGSGQSTFNSGYNYGPFVQYDDYGAAIQIEQVPIYYDYYGRIIQAGNVVMRYTNFGRLASIGRMRMHYDRYNRFINYSGFINSANRGYNYKPWHKYYRRPVASHRIIYKKPYRAYYKPHRISYNNYREVYRSNYQDRKRTFYRPNDRVSKYRYGAKTSQSRDLKNIKTRTNNSLARSRQEVARKKAAKNKAETSQTKNRRTRVTRNPQRVPEDRIDHSARTRRDIKDRGNRDSVISTSKISENRSRNTDSRKSRVQKTERVSRNTRTSRSIPKRKSKVRTPRNQGEIKQNNTRKTSREKRRNSSSRNRSSARNMSL